MIDGIDLKKYGGSFPDLTTKEVKKCVKIIEVLEGTNIDKSFYILDKVKKIITSKVPIPKF